MATGYAFDVWRARGLQICKVLSAMLACCALALMAATVFLGWVLVSYNHSVLLNVLYAALNRPIWAACLSILLVCCTFGSVPIITPFLQWRAWALLSRLVYGVYLIHGILIFRNVGVARNPAHYDFLISVADVVTTLVTAVVSSPRPALCQRGRLKVPENLISGRYDSAVLVLSAGDLVWSVILASIQWLIIEAPLSNLLHLCLSFRASPLTRKDVEQAEGVGVKKAHRDLRRSGHMAVPVVTFDHVYMYEYRSLCNPFPICDQRNGCVRPLSLFYSDASADGVEERSYVPRSRSHARLRRNATMSHAFFVRAAGVHRFIRRYLVKTPYSIKAPAFLARRLSRLRLIGKKAQEVPMARRDAVLFSSIRRNNSGPAQHNDIIGGGRDACASLAAKVEAARFCRAPPRRALARASRRHTRTATPPGPGDDRASQRSTARRGPASDTLRDPGHSRRDLEEPGKEASVYTLL
ncbi:hypothetical protein EVAR_74824_1 [Eumeta japonica]|uniref:Nose resistant to fluoxetine protein 6 n=1 Tax=Eumeta variegata TaxID=151549 RepID=A0A4C1SPC5_EUMVA|nr:hypothetical protein EVAR_74824_1 [Eumeta japonica]